MDTINAFQTRVRQLMLHIDQLLKENEELYGMVAAAEKEAADLKAELRRKEEDLKALRLAKMMSISNGDLDTAKAIITAMIREVNKCMAIVKGQDTDEMPTV